MPRYLVERSFPEGLPIPLTEEGTEKVPPRRRAQRRRRRQWVHSYVIPSRTKSFCIYDGPTPESIRKAPSARGCRWTRSPRFPCWIRTSIAASIGARSRMTIELSKEARQQAIALD